MVILSSTTLQVETANATSILIILGAMLILCLAVTILFWLTNGRRQSVAGATLALTLLGTIGTVRTAYQLNYLWSDTPREMMIYTQTSPDIAAVVARLEQASVRRTSGLTMPIWYDGETIWNWYLRRFSAGVEHGTLPSAPPPEVQAVLLGADGSTLATTNALAEFRLQRIPLRWWFPEDQTYRLPDDWLTAPVNRDSSLLLRLLRTPNDGRTLAQSWRFLVYREPPAPLGAVNATIAVRPDLAEELGLGTGGSLSK